MYHSNPNRWRVCLYPVVTRWSAKHKRLRSPPGVDSNVSLYRWRARMQEGTLTLRTRKWLHQMLYLHHIRICQAQETKTPKNCDAPPERNLLLDRNLRFRVFNRLNQHHSILKTQLCSRRRQHRCSFLSFFSLWSSARIRSKLTRKI